MRAATGMSRGQEVPMAAVRAVPVSRVSPTVPATSIAMRSGPLPGTRTSRTCSYASSTGAFGSG